MKTTKKEVRKMININISRKHLLVFLAIVVIATVVNYAIAQIGAGEQGHEAGELYPGTFQAGTYTFPAGSKVVAPEVCIPSDSVDNCQTAWPSGGGGEFLIYNIIGGPGLDHCRGTCGDYGKDCAFSWEMSGDYVQLLGDCTSTAADKCACYP